MTIYEKLLEIQTKLKAPKSQYNKFGDFHYRSCEDVLEAVKPLAQEVKAVLTVTDEIVNIGARFYVRATAALQDVESDGRVAVCAYAREPEARPKMDEAQVTGSTSSYARKYALNGLFCIDDAKDPDAVNADGKPQQREPQARKPQPRTDDLLTPAEYHNLIQEAERKGVSHASICQRYGKGSLKELSSLEYQKAMSGLAKMPDRSRTRDEFGWMEAETSELPFR